jgi:Fic family protein
LSAPNVAEAVASSETAPEMKAMAGEVRASSALRECLVDGRRGGSEESDADGHLYDVLVSTFPQLRPLSEEELRVLDASYTPIPSFSEWPTEPPRAELWDRLCHDLARLRDAPGASSALGDARTTVLRTAAFETGAIEGLYETDRGLTFSVATKAAAWESEVTKRSADALKLFEAQLAAYELVLDVATQDRPVTEVWIRHLHELLTGPQETYTVVTPVGVQERPLPNGEYKRDPNHVRLSDGSVHSYAPVEETAAEMGRLVKELRSETFVQAHAFVQASYAHYCLVGIHPFADGNGRVARAVASTYLYRAASIPLLVLADQRPEYFHALEQADAGDRAPFVAFVGEEARSAISMIIDSLKSAIAPRPETSVTALKSLLIAQGGLTHQELGSIATQLVGTIAAAIRERLQELDLPPGVSGSTSQGSSNQSEAQRAGFRAIPHQTAGAQSASLVWISLNSAAPAEASITENLEILISASQDDAETFLVAAIGADDQDLIFGLRDVYPELTVAARYRLDAFVNRLLGIALDRLLREANTSLVRSGYQVANYESRVRAGDLAMPVEHDTLLAYVLASSRAERLGDLAQRVGFAVLPAEGSSLNALLAACVQEGFTQIDELDRCLASAEPWTRAVLTTLWEAKPSSTWNAPLPFVLAAIVWIGGSADLERIRQASGADDFFIAALGAARNAINE